MSPDEYKNYIAFMHDEKNIEKCDCCPMNRGFDCWESNYPCGQQNCWVAVHCQYNERKC